jgi:two-component system nitrate/nitrite response regulator NarL
MMAQLTSFPLHDRIRVLAADNTAMNTQLLVEALARDAQFAMSTPSSLPSEIMGAVKRESPHVALISSRQGNDSRGGFALTREIRSASPNTKVIMLLDVSERTPVIEAFRCGVRGVFSRTEPLKLLAKSIRCVHEGQIWASSAELKFVLEAVMEPVPMSFLSANGESILSTRELDVVRCVAEGLSNREIAQRLTLREHTVKNYLFRIFDKLGVSSRVEVVLYALGSNQSPASKPEAPSNGSKDTAAASARPRSDGSMRLIRQ